MQQFPTISYIYFSNEQGELIRIERFDDRSLWIQLIDRSTNGIGHRYRIDMNGNRVELIKITSLQYEPSERFWYKTPVQNDSSEFLTQKTAQYLSQHFSSLPRITTTEQLEFWLDGKQQFLQIVPFQHGRSLDWLTVVVVPEADFMAQINANTHRSILLCLAALVLTTVIAILTTRWAIQPIVRLNTAAKAIAKGEWDKTLAYLLVVMTFCVNPSGMQISLRQ